MSEEEEEEEGEGFWRPLNVQALIDGSGTWGDAAGGQRSSWEGNARLDLRAVRDSRGFLPYHEALIHNMGSLSQLLHPGIPILRAINYAGAAFEGKRTLLAPSVSVICMVSECSKPLHSQHA